MTSGFGTVGDIALHFRILIRCIRSVGTFSQRAPHNWARLWGLQAPRSSINQLPWPGCISTYFIPWDEAVYGGFLAFPLSGRWGGLLSRLGDW